MLLQNLKPLLTYFPQLLTTIIVSFGSICDGIQYGWQSPTVPMLQEPDSPIHSPHVRVATGLAGLHVLHRCIFCAALCSLFQVKLGPKLIIQFATTFFCIAWTIVAFATEVGTLYSARFTAGFGPQTYFTAWPLYIAAIADKRIRGMLSSIVSTNFILRIVIVYAVRPFTTIQNMVSVGLATGVIQLITLSPMPKSPYFKLMKIDEKGAENSLKFLRRSQNVKEELTEIRAAVERRESERGLLKDLFMVASNRRGVITSAVLTAAQNFSGFSIFLMNLHTILADANGLFDVSQAAIVFSTVMYIKALISPLILEKIGRNKLLNISCVITGIALGLVSIYFWLKAYNVDLLLVRWLPAALVVLYAVGFVMGLNLVPIVLSSELYPTSVKAIGMNTANALFYFFALASMYFHRFVSEAYGLHTAFLIYMFCSFATIIFTTYFVPETNGKTLEEIQMILKGINRDAVK